MMMLMAWRARATRRRLTGEQPREEAWQNPDQGHAEQEAHESVRPDEPLQQDWVIRKNPLYRRQSYLDHSQHHRVDREDEQGVVGDPAEAPRDGTERSQGQSAKDTQGDGEWVEQGRDSESQTVQVDEPHEP